MHVRGHSAHAAHAPAQSTGHRGVLHSPTSSAAGHASPPCSGACHTANVRALVGAAAPAAAVAQEAEHSPHVAHAPAQSTGHGCVLHAW